MERRQSKFQSLGGNLITISSSTMNNQLWQLISQPTGSNYWIGLNDINVEGTFVWVDGSTSSYRQWDTDEPNNSQNEDCGELLANRYWNDLHCSNS
jgi:hypothetical protein